MPLKNGRILIWIITSFLALPGCKNGYNGDGGASNSTYPLAGTWRATVVEQGQEMVILWHALPDGTTFYRVTHAEGTFEMHGTWKMSNGILDETSAEADPAKSSIKWIDENTFILTIIDNGDADSKGTQRHYKRVQTD